MVQQWINATGDTGTDIDKVLHSDRSTEVMWVMVVAELRVVKGIHLSEQSSVIQGFELGPTGAVQLWLVLSLFYPEKQVFSEFSDS